MPARTGPPGDAGRRALAVVAGHICLDIIPRLGGRDLSRISLPGSLTEVGPASIVAGGAVSNTGRALHRLGIATRLVGRVGSDALGALTVNILRTEDPALGADIKVDYEYASSYSIVLSPPGGDRSFLHHGGANDSFVSSDVDDVMLAGADLMHFGYPPLMRGMYADGGSQLEELYRRAATAGAVTSLDLATPDRSGESGRPDWPAVLARALPHVDIFLATAGELDGMLMTDRATGDGGWGDGGWNVPALAESALGLGARLVVVKLGARGIYLRSSTVLPAGAGEAWRSRELWAPAFSVMTVAGTTGAGDAAAAGLLAAFLRGQPPEAALRMAAAVGACCVEAVDSVGGVLSWERTQARMDAGWPTAPREIALPGWRGDATGCWHGPGDRA